MLSIRNQLLRRSIRSFKWRRNYSGPPPTYSTYDPVHISPGVLVKKSPLQTVLTWFLAGACVGLPSYWILWLEQKVSIPYCSSLSMTNVDIGRLDSFQTKLSEEQKNQLKRIFLCTILMKGI